MGDFAALVQMWRVYQRGLERWIADLLQPVFDNLVTDGMVPRFVQVSFFWLAAAIHITCCRAKGCSVILVGLSNGAACAASAHPGVHDRP